jgi:hypothetical protein
MSIREESSAALQVLDPPQACGVPLQTCRRSFEEICAGSDPWLPLGNFMHQFFGYYKHLRAQLMCEPVEVPAQLSLSLFRWAVFCAASVEYLCEQYDLPCPQWAQDPQFFLEEPWYYAIGADLPRVQEKLRQTTPEPFKRRNVFFGDRVYRNKYEYEGRQRRRTA